MKTATYINKIKESIAQTGSFEVKAETKGWDIAYELAFLGFLENITAPMFSNHKFIQTKDFSLISKVDLEYIESLNHDSMK